MLKLNTIDGIIDKEQIAIERIKKYTPKDGYYVAFSGGKDSIVIEHLTKRAGVKCDIHFNMTTVDPPELTKFIKEYYPEVIWDKPKISMFQLIKKKKLLPTRIIRFCCHYLKELGGNGRIVILGVRRAESYRRRNRQVFEQSQRNKKTYFLCPIVDWSDKDVWDYIHKHNLKYPSLYDEGYTRIGCIMCPMQGTKGMLLDKKRYPKYYNAYLKAVEYFLIKRKEEGNVFKAGKTAEEIMDWWIYGGYDEKMKYIKKHTKNSADHDWW